MRGADNAEWLRPSALLEALETPTLETPSAEAAPVDAPSAEAAPLDAPSDEEAPLELIADELPSRIQPQVDESPVDLLPVDLLTLDCAEHPPLETSATQASHEQQADSPIQPDGRGQVQGESGELQLDRAHQPLDEPLAQPPSDSEPETLI